jgi:hypothetical protein
MVRTQEEELFTFRVLQHFSNREPIILRFRAPSNITLNEFINKIIHDMTRESLMSIYQLNITQYCENMNQVLPFIMQCEGELNIHHSEHLSQTFDNIRRNLLLDMD